MFQKRFEEMKTKIVGDLIRRVHLEMADIEDLRDLRLLKSEIEQQIIELEELDFQKRDAKNWREDKNRKKREEELRPRLKRFAETILKPGMRVWMKGCRDRQGYREILAIKNIDCESGPTIECRQVHLTREYSPGKCTNFIVVETLGQITEHYFDKIISLDTRRLTSSWDIQIDKVQRMPIRKVLDHLGI